MPCRSSPTTQAQHHRLHPSNLNHKGQRTLNKHWIKGVQANRHLSSYSQPLGHASSTKSNIQHPISHISYFAFLINGCSTNRCAHFPECSMYRGACPCPCLERLINAVWKSSERGYMMYPRKAQSASCNGAAHSCRNYAAENEVKTEKWKGLFVQLKATMLGIIVLMSGACGVCDDRTS